MCAKECNKICYNCSYLLFIDSYICGHEDSNGKFVKEEDSCPNFNYRKKDFWL